MNEENTPLELDVKDFGPIAKAKVELRPLTVFVGASNTGKSYLAILIYALHRFFCRHGRYSRGFQIFRPAQKNKIFEKSMEHLIDLFQSLEDNRGNSKKTEILLSPSVIDLLQSGVSRNGALLADEICRCFGAGGMHSLIRKQGGSDKAQIIIRRTIPDHPEIVEHSLTLAGNSKFQMRLPENLQIAVDLDMNYRVRHFIGQIIREKRNDLAKQDFLVYELLEFLGRVISPSVLGLLAFPSLLSTG